MLKDNSVLLMPNVLKVFLENGQIKSFTFDNSTTVKDVLSSLQDRLSLRYMEHFALVLEHSGLDKKHKFYLLEESEPLYHVVQRTYFQGMKCLFRICFYPMDPADLLKADPAAFEYLYIQSRNDVIKERCGTDWKLDVILKLAALHIFITVSSARPNQKISLKYVEEEWGLEPFLPPTLLPSVKEKNVCKSLGHLLKSHQHFPPFGNKISPLQGKLQYLRILNDLPPFGGLIFHTVAQNEKMASTTLLVGPKHGVCQVTDLKHNLTTVLVEFQRVTRVQLFWEDQAMARVEVSILEAKPLIMLMEWAEASNFACLIAGYYKLFVDPKKTVYRQSLCQSHMMKAVLAQGSRICEEAFMGQSHLKDWAKSYNRTSCPCYHLLKEKQPFQQFQHQGQAAFNGGEKAADNPAGRIKADPKLKSAECAALQRGLGPDAEHRAKAGTLGPSVQAECFLCDSCKAQLKVPVKEKGGSHRATLRRCSTSREPRCTATLGLRSLSLRTARESKGQDKGRGRAPAKPTPAKKCPSPGFQDNNSDEDSPKKKHKTHKVLARKKSVKKATVMLTDATASSRVQGHAKELDDALLSTLQAIEALAASEDYIRNCQPTSNTGLTTLGAFTPESSLHKTQEVVSTVTEDVSELMSAPKQQQSQTYVSDQHSNTDYLFSHGESPLPVPSYSKQNLGRTCHLGTIHPLSKLTSPRLPAILSSARQAMHLGNFRNGLSPRLFAVKSTICNELTINQQDGRNRASSEPRACSSSPSKEAKEHDKDPKGKICALPQAETLCIQNNPSGSKSLLSEDLFCNFSDQSMNLQTHSPSLTNDEHLLAKIHQESKKHGTNEDLENNIAKSIFPTKYSIFNPVKAKLKKKLEINNKGVGKPSKQVPSQVEVAQVNSCVSAGFAAESKVKLQSRAPLVRLRNLFSTTFFTQQKLKTNERWIQLHKVRQYKIDFLDKLLKPKNSLVESLPQGPFPVSAGIHHLFDLHTSTLQKFADISRDQWQNCDGKRKCCEFRFPDTPIGFTMECRERERTVSKTLPFVTKSSHFHEVSSRCQSSGIKTTRIRSISLESIEPCAESSFSLPTSPSQYRYIEIPDFKKQLCSKSINTVDINDQNAIYAEIKPVRNKRLQKDIQQVRATTLQPSLTPDYTHVRHKDRKRKGIFPTLREERQKDNEMEPRKETPNKLTDKDDYYCSFCLCYRKCSSECERNTKGKMSHSLPLKVLPEMQLDVHAFSLVSNAQQVFEVDDYCLEEKGKQISQNQKAALLACSLAKIQSLQAKTFSLSTVFQEVQVHTNELLAILQKFAGTLRAETKSGLQSPWLPEYKLELAQYFKEFRVSCQQIAGVEKSPTQMLNAIGSSFQVLCGLVQTFLWLLQDIHSEAQRVQLFHKVKEVALNYTLLLRAAEDSVGPNGTLYSETNQERKLSIPATIRFSPSYRRTQVAK